MSSPWWTRRHVQFLAAGSGVVVSILLAATSVWPFDTTPPPLEPKPSLSQLLLSDRAILGFARLALVALMLFVIASIPALLVAGRWLRAFGTSGISADEVAQTSGAVAELENQAGTLAAQVDRLTRERDDARELADQLLAGQRRSSG